MGRKSREKRERRTAAETYRRNYLNPRPRQNYPAQPLASEGLTDAERDLAKLCRRTFLSSWSYPNVFRAELQPNGGKISKEVCDLLVVFGDHVVIFSDKDCVFPASGDIDKDWSRWFRRAVEHSAKQLRGAERVIRSGVPLFLDAELKVPFPLRLPDTSRMKIHRVLVAHGASERCRAALGGSGTLMIQPGIVGSADHLKKVANGGMPFTVGDVDPRGGYIHVMDDTSLVLLLRTLDTAPDLIAYLEKKEAFVNSGHLGFAAGEEALLGFYLSDINSDGDHDFIVGDGPTPMALDETWWHRYVTGPEAPRKRAADAISYMWDDLTELFARHFRHGTADHLTDTDADAHANLLRLFARENRTRRRMLSNALREMLETTPAQRVRRLRVIAPSRAGDPHWLFMLLPRPTGMSYRQYREGRRRHLEECCLVARLMHPEALDIVGFATEAGRGTEGSEDAAYFDARNWTEEMAEEARALQKQHRILTSVTMTHGTEYEYPPED